jgi:hypothetical protein
MASISIDNGLSAVDVATLSNEQVAQCVELIGEQTDDAVRERVHLDGHDDARAFLAAYAAAYAAAHGRVWVLG